MGGKHWSQADKHRKPQETKTNTGGQEVNLAHRDANIDRGNNGKCRRQKGKQGMVRSKKQETERPT